MSNRPLVMLRDYCAVFRTIEKRVYSPKGFSWVCAFLLDCALGCAFLHLISGIRIFPILWPLVDRKIQELDTLIGWLTQNPAGLKLNEPLNMALASFFRYHIYLWHTFVQMLRVEWLWEYLPYTLACGLSMAFAVVADMISLFSMHIMCFYVYAFRLTRITFTCLSSLWRAFRGKKYNPLRDRVDTAYLDTRQLFLATLLFVIMVFLSPTVIVYCIVFSTVRWSVRLVQIVVEKCANFQQFVDDFIAKR